MRPGVLMFVFASLTAACTSAPSTLPSPPTSANSTHLDVIVDNTRFQVLSGVTVEIVDGPLLGMMVVTGADGRARFDGEAIGVVEVRAERDGYVAATTPLVWRPPNDFDVDVLYLEQGVPSTDRGR